MNKDKTDFGFTQVDKDRKADMVAGVFHSVAAKYDIMNDLMSGGIHRVWKHFTIQSSGVREGHQVLDIAGGTGDLSASFAKLVGPTGKVILADINASMLNVGRDKLIDNGFGPEIEYLQTDAQFLPFEDNTFHCISIAFGLRNVTDKSLAIAEMYRVLKPGGRLLILEFSKPVSAQLAKIYDTYSFKILPKLGQWVAGDSESYQYLAESIRMHPDQETLKNMMLQGGFEKAEYQNMTGGIVALHRGFKL